MKSRNQIMYLLLALLSFGLTFCDGGGESKDDSSQVFTKISDPSIIIANGTYWEICRDEDPDGETHEYPLVDDGATYRRYWAIKKYDGDSIQQREVTKEASASTASYSESYDLTYQSEKVQHSLLDANVDDDNEPEDFYTLVYQGDQGQYKFECHYVENDKLKEILIVRRVINAQTISMLDQAVFGSSGDDDDDATVVFFKVADPSTIMVNQSYWEVHQVEYSENDSEFYPQTEDAKVYHCYIAINDFYNTGSIYYREMEKAEDDKSPEYYEECMLECNADKIYFYHVVSSTGARDDKKYDTSLYLGTNGKYKIDFYDLGCDEEVNWTLYISRVTDPALIAIIDAATPMW